MPMSARNELRPVRPAHYADTFWATYIISVAAASVAEFATYPLDLTKTRLQIQGEAASTSGKQMVSLTGGNQPGVDDNRVNNSIKRAENCFAIDNNSEDNRRKTPQNMKTQNFLSYQKFGGFFT
jgi:hypothetical protein